MLPNIGMGELVIILLVVLLLFGGASKLPDLAKSIGKSIRSFKDGMNEATKDDKK